MRYSMNSRMLNLLFVLSAQTPIRLMHHNPLIFKIVVNVEKIFTFPQIDNIIYIQILYTNKCF